MKTLRSKLLLGVAAAFALSTTAAHAAITFTTTSGPDTGPPAGFVTVLDYDGISGYFAESGSTNVTATTIPGQAAAPLGQAAGNNFAYLEQGQSYTLTAPAITGFSFYLGSLDNFNTIAFYSGATLLGDFGGAAFGPLLPANVNQVSPLDNLRITFNFNGDVADKIVFHSYGESMEWDTIAVPSAVPEPATWAMMITGFGLMGAMLRRRRLAAIPA